MHISFKNLFYLSTCSFIGGLNAFECRDYDYISTFAIGIVAGIIRGFYNLHRVTGNYTTEEKRISAEFILQKCMPGILATGVNLLALGIISKKIPFHSQFDTGMTRFISGLGAFLLGADYGSMLFLNSLRGNQDPAIKDLVDATY